MLSAAFLERLVRATERVAADVPTEDLLRGLLVSRHQLATLLGSARLTEGLTVDERLRAHVELEREQLGRYQDTLRVVLAAAPSAYPIKGLSISARYPPDWVRSMTDLDLVVNRRDFWQAARKLRESGFDPVSLTLLPVSRRLELLLVLDGHYISQLGRAESVDLATIPITANLKGRESPPTPGAAVAIPGVRDLIALLGERDERAFHARDLVDAALVLDALDTDVLARLWEVLERFDLWPEWVELADSLSRFGLLPEWVPAPEQFRRAARRSRTRRFDSSRRGGVFGQYLARPLAIMCVPSEGREQWQHVLVDYSRLVESPFTMGGSQAGITRNQGLDFHARSIAFRAGRSPSHHRVHCSRAVVACRTSSH